MWSYVRRLLWRQRTRSLFASGGFLLAACTLILLTATTQTTTLRANQLISQNWRPSYDLVVLPTNVHLPAGKPIPADALEGYGGGISIQQYQQIQQISGVAVAAPIAFVGYVPFPSIGVLSGPTAPVPGFYDVTWTLTAFNGRQQVIEGHDSGRYYVFPNQCASPCILSDQAANDLNQLGIVDYTYTNFPLIAQIPYADPNIHRSFGLGTFLLAAIDPTAESQLVHLDKSIVSGKMLTEQQGAQLDSTTPNYVTSDESRYPNYDVPVLLNAHPSGQVRLVASIRHIESSTADLNRVLALGGNSYLDHLPSQSLFADDVPLARNNPHWLTQTNFVCNGQTCSAPPNQNIGFLPLDFTSTPSGLTYAPAVAPAGYAGPAYTLVPSIPPV